MDLLCILRSPSFCSCWYSILGLSWFSVSRIGICGIWLRTCACNLARLVTIWLFLLFATALLGLLLSSFCTVFTLLFILFSFGFLLLLLLLRSLRLHSCFFCSFGISLRLLLLCRQRLACCFISIRVLVWLLLPIIRFTTLLLIAFLLFLGLTWLLFTWSC